MESKRILITGAAGQIGVALRQGLAGSYALLRQADIAPRGHTAPGEELCTCDLRDMPALEKGMEGIDCVVHLGGVSVKESWEKCCRPISKAATTCSRSTRTGMAEILRKVALKFLSFSWPCTQQATMGRERGRCGIAAAGASGAMRKAPLIVWLAASTAGARRTSRITGR